MVLKPQMTLVIALNYTIHVLVTPLQLLFNFAIQLSTCNVCSVIFNSPIYNQYIHKVNKNNSPHEALAPTGTPNNNNSDFFVKCAFPACQLTFHVSCAHISKLSFRATKEGFKMFCSQVSYALFVLECCLSLCRC